MVEALRWEIMQTAAGARPCPVKSMGRRDDSGPIDNEGQLLLAAALTRLERADMETGQNTMPFSHHKELLRLKHSGSG